jgi:hypothetical protein
MSFVAPFEERMFKGDPGIESIYLWTKDETRRQSPWRRPYRRQAARARRRRRLRRGYLDRSSFIRGKMPIVLYGPRGRMVEWQLPRYNTIHRLLTNPVYAGAYVFGRTGSEVRVEAGRKLITRSVCRLQPEWEVLIRDHHEGYISWDDYHMIPLTSTIRMETNRYGIENFPAGLREEMKRWTNGLPGAAKRLDSALALLRPSP